MQYFRRQMVYLLICLLLVEGIVITSSSSNPPDWNKNWKYKQRIILPISTDTKKSFYQPIDIKIDFEYPCWARNSSYHSIRVCCWQNNKWYELESQIYNLNYTDSTHINSCGLVFLVPPIADGEEQYFIYYDDGETSPPIYKDHVSIRDRHYYYEPISGLSVEGDYYEIIDDGEIVYGVGEKGQVLNRRLSQVVIKMKPGTKNFDILNSDLLTSFAFAFYRGTEETDEVSSDQKLISKDILVDGNLMVAFTITSGSNGGELRTTNIYKYYHSPVDPKRIIVHVHHEILKDCQVKGIENVDGRFGAIISYHSKSSVTDKMCFGSILPFLHVFEDDNRIHEYRLQANPESRDRTWIISYNDDCDLGNKAWFSYDVGKKGKTHGIILSSNHNLIYNASGERDGVEIKLAEKEYLNIVGTEVDYASIAFGRNSFESYTTHDTNIPKGLNIEFYAEFITFQNATFEDVSIESNFFQPLSKSRYQTGSMEGEKNIYTLTVIPHLTGRIGSFPLLRNITGLNLTILKGELYHNNSLVETAYSYKPFIGFQILKFPSLEPGRYTVKIYRIYKNISRYIGVGIVNVLKDTTFHIYCTWPQYIKFKIENQYHKAIKEVDIEIFKINDVIERYTTTNQTVDVIPIPFPLFSPYIVENLNEVSMLDLFKVSYPYIAKIYYKGFLVNTTIIPRFKPYINITIPLYDLTINIKDRLDFPPAVGLNVFLTSNKMLYPIELKSRYIGQGCYRFEDIPASTYILQITFGGYIFKKNIEVPTENNVSINFVAAYNLEINLLNRRGEPISPDNYNIIVERNNRIISKYKQPISLPPAEYIVNVYDGKTLIGSTLIDLTSDRTIKIVTSTSSLIYNNIIISSIIIILSISILLYFHRISFNSFMKILTIVIVLLSIVFPWWNLYASTGNHEIWKTSYMYLYPQNMIEHLVVNEEQYFSCATIPEVFTDFLRTLLLVITVGLMLMGISFIPNIALKKRYALLLVIISVIFVIIVAAAFLVGMSRLTELSLGSLQGTGDLEISMIHGDTVNMKAEWGLGLGFYLIIFAAIVSITAGIIDFLRSKGFLKGFVFS